MDVSVTVNIQHSVNPACAHLQRNGLARTVCVLSFARCSIPSAVINVQKYSTVQNLISKQCVAFTMIYLSIYLFLYFRQARNQRPEQTNHCVAEFHLVVENLIEWSLQKTVA